MTAAALKLKLNLKPMNFMTQDHLKPDFLKINPQHTVPTLVDNEFSIWESRAISIYLIEKYASNDSLYPKNPKVRAVINQRLYFDMGTLWKNFHDYFFAPFYGREQTPEGLKKFEESVEMFNKFLDENEFVAGTKKLSVADLSLFASVSTFEVFDFDFSPFSNVSKWLEMMNEKAPGHELNADGVKNLKVMMKAYANRDE
jgi:glutathione S-transferase